MRQKYTARKLSRIMERRLTVIGVSAGAVDALKVVLANVNDARTTSIIIVAHIRDSIDGFMNIFGKVSSMRIKEAEGGEMIVEQGYIYFAPPEYHLAIENDYSFSLALEEKVNFVRPSADILFESAAETYREGLTGIILTGTNYDGANGMKRIEELGGACIVQCPEEARFDTMPKAAISKLKFPKIATLAEINDLIRGGVD